MILCYEHSLITYNPILKIPGHRIIPYLDTSSQITYPTTFSTKFHVQVSLNILCTSFYGLYCVMFLLREKTSIWLVITHYRYTIDTAENKHVVLTSLSVIRNINIQVFQDMIWDLRSLTNNGTRKILQILEISVPMMLFTIIGLALSVTHTFGSCKYQTFDQYYFMVVEPFHDPHIFKGYLQSKTNSSWTSVPPRLLPTSCYK